MNKTKNIITFIIIYAIILLIICYKTYDINKRPFDAFVLILVFSVLFYKYININYNKYNKYNKYTKYKLDNKKKQINNKVSYRYFYSFWIFIWLILIKLNIVSVSCFPSILISSIFVVFLIYFILNNINNINNKFIFFIIFLHILGIVFTPYDLSYKTITINSLVFLLYLFFLAIHHTTFKNIYFNYNINYLPYTKLSSKYFTDLFYNAI